MKMHLLPAALPLLLALAGCGPGVAQYTSSEAPAPARLTLDSVAHDVPIAFRPGSPALAPGQAWRLKRLAQSGAVAPSDRVVVAAAGGPDLAARRVAAVGHVLLAYGIVPVQGTLAELPPNRGVLHVGRTMVTLPPCPNWSKQSGTDFTNTVGSNFGCATESDLGLMVANPGDLVAGRSLGPANGTVAANAMQRYLTGTELIPKQFDGASASPGSTAAATASPGGGK